MTSRGLSISSSPPRRYCLEVTIKLTVLSISVFCLLELVYRALRGRRRALTTVA